MVKSNAALHLAITQGKIEQVTRLIEEDPGLLNAVRENGSGYTPILTAIDNNQFDILELLLKLGADTEQKAGEFTALSIAVINTRAECVYLLLKYNRALVNKGIPYHRYHYTPLHTIARRIKYCSRNTATINCAKLLLLYGADLNACKKSENGEKVGKTPEEITPFIATLVKELKLLEIYNFSCKEIAGVWVLTDVEGRWANLLLGRSLNAFKSSNSILRILPQEIIDKVRHYFSVASISRHIFPPTSNTDTADTQQAPNFSPR